MIGKLENLAFSRNGEQIISFSTKSDFTEAFDTMKGAEVEIEIKKHYEKRSKNANDYCWALCDKIAEVMSRDDPKINKDVIYREAIMQVGIYRDYDNLTISGYKALKHVWEKQGTGWPTEIIETYDNGQRVTVRCYYGSRSYNTKQMSRLIDSLIEDCRSLGIPTETPEQIAKIKSLWANEPKKGQ